MKRKSMYPMAFAAAAVALFATSISLRASETDDKIESSFKKTYVYQTYLKDDEVKAESKDGVVTLTGTVAEPAHKALAQETAASLPGVTRVENKLETKAEATAESADTTIRRKVQFALLIHRHVSAGKTAVEVKEGVVTLKGEALSVAQKELTTEYAKDIDGVKMVKNEMTVAETPEKTEVTAGEKIDDASISAQVKTVLAAHRSTSAMKTKVETVNGEVTLTGPAQNATAKALVTKLVENIQGVTSVKNEMSVEEPKTE